MANPYTEAVMQLDANGNVVGSPLPFFTKKTSVYVGGTTNAVGDFDGTGNPDTLFTVTGSVLGFLIGVCKVDLVSTSGTLKVGVLGYLNSLIDTKTASAVDIQKILSRDDMNFAVDIGNFRPFARNVIQTVETANITAGEIDWYLFWRPVSQDGNVVAA